MSLIITSGYGQSGSSEGFVASSVVGRNKTITITFADGFPATDLNGDSADPANWVLTGPGSVVVDNVAIDSGTVVLTVSPFIVIDGEYTLVVPNGLASGGFAYVGLSPLAFTGATALPVLLSAYPVDARTLEIVFNNAMVKSQATDASRYSISPELAVTSVERVTDTVYRLTTDRQLQGTSYTLTATNIADIYGNVV